VLSDIVSSREGEEAVVGCLAYIDDFFAFIELHGGPAICQRWSEDGVQVVRPVTTEEFCSLVGSFQMGSIGLVNMANRWIRQHPGRTKYLHRGFYPGENPPDTLNLFSGFAFDRDLACGSQEDLARAEEDCAPLIQHIKSVWCRNDPRSFSYVLDWMAHVLQRPHVKTGVAIVVSGREGCGKGVTVQKFFEVIGKRHCRQTANIADICTFNEYCLSDSLLLFLDEAVVTSDRSTRGKLYSVITEHEMVYERKFGSRWVGPNRTNVIMASNHDHVANIDGAGRRFMVLEASSDHAFSFEADRVALHQSYHDKIIAVPPQSFAAFLWSRDISNFNPRAVPYTRYLAIQQALSVDPKLQWLIKCIDDNRIVRPSYMGSWDRVMRDNPAEIATAEEEDFGDCWLNVDACISSFEHTCNVRRSGSHTAFFMFLNKVLGGKIVFARKPPPCSGLYALFPRVETVQQLISNFLGRSTYDFGVLGMTYSDTA
jgi:hypothetical protein